MAAEISTSEVKKHKDKKSLWMVIHNEVYDVTKFLEEHPGGEDALLEYAGKDGTQAFEDVGHSQDARELMVKFKIGKLPASEKTKDVVKNCQGQSRTCPSCLLGSKSPVKETKSWRTFDGSSGSDRIPKPKSTTYKKPTIPQPERHLKGIVVPREGERKKGPEPSSGGALKWALLALAGAIIIGVVLKKYMS